MYVLFNFPMTEYLYDLFGTDSIDVQYKTGK